MPKTIRNVYDEAVSFDKILMAHKKARRGKREKKEVIIFKLNLESEILRLEEELKHGRYKPGQYKTFKIYGEELIATNEPQDITTAKEPVFYFARNLKELSEFNLSNDILCEFEVDEKLLKKGFGKVQLKDLYEEEPYFVHDVPEYEITTYSDQTFKLIGCRKMEKDPLSFKSTSVRDVPDVLKEYIEKYHSNELPSYLYTPDVDFDMFEDFDMYEVLYERGVLSDLEYDSFSDLSERFDRIHSCNGIEELREVIIENYYKNKEYDGEDIDWDILIFLRSIGCENLKQYEEMIIKWKEQEAKWEEEWAKRLDEESEDIEFDNDEMSNGYTPQEIADGVSITSTELQGTLGEILEIKKEKDKKIGFDIGD